MHNVSEYLDKSTNDTHPDFSAVLPNVVQTDCSAMGAQLTSPGASGVGHDDDRNEHADEEAGKLGMDKPSTAHQNNYRPDIDGLRTVAVVAVIIFHYFPDALPGGFVGVDIFFVISGFLISAIIFRQVESGTFTYANFYAKRIRRIFPTLIIVLLFVIVVGAARLDDQPLDIMYETAAWGCAFSANIGLAFSIYSDTAGGSTVNSTQAESTNEQPDGYWAQLEQPSEPAAADDSNQSVGAAASHTQGNPLLHLWSLGVEEQFYIIWPVLVPLLSKQRPWVTVTGFAVVIIVSFASNLILCYGWPESTYAYYLPFSRVWQLAIGAFASWGGAHSSQLQHTIQSKSDKWSLPRVCQPQELASCSGLVLIVLSLVFTKKAVMFPGWIAILPTLGTAAVIVAGPDALVNKWAIGSTVMATFGKWSYALYMWHWPLLVYGLDVFQGMGTAAKLGCMAVALVLSIGTTHLLENPLRYLKYSHTPGALGGIVFALFVAAVIGGWGTPEPLQVDQPLADSRGSTSLAPWVQAELPTEFNGTTIVETRVSELNTQRRRALNTQRRRATANDFHLSGNGNRTGVLNIAFMGDSVTRFQYASLVHFVHFGRWIEPSDITEQKWVMDPPIDPVENNRPFHEWFKTWGAYVDHYERCDCYRAADGLNVDQIIENRYYHHPVLGHRLTYILAYGRTSRGHWDPTALPTNPEISNQFTPVSWSMDSVSTITDHIALLSPKPDFLVFNSGLWGNQFYDVAFRTAVIAALRKAGIRGIWKTTTFARDWSVPRCFLTCNTDVYTAAGDDQAMCDAADMCLNLSWFRDIEYQWYSDAIHYFEPVYRLMNEQLLTLVNSSF